MPTPNALLAVAGASLIAWGDARTPCVIEPTVEIVPAVRQLAAARSRIAALEAENAELKSQAASPLPQPAVAVEPVVPATEITWRTDLATAAAEAAQAGRPLLVHVTQENCAPCVRLRAFWRVPNIVRWHRHFVCVKATPEQAAELGVRSTPTTVVLMGRRELRRFGVVRSEAHYARELQAAYLAAKAAK